MLKVEESTAAIPTLCAEQHHHQPPLPAQTVSRRHRGGQKAFKFSSEEAGALAVKKAMEGIRKVSAAEPHDRCEEEKEIRMSLQSTILVCLHRQRNCPNRSETIEQLGQ
jgi:hypothetical protein